MKLRQNWERIWQQMDEALDKSGRSREEITLIAVSKTRTAEEIKAVYDFGQLDFGENKPQEIRDKLPVLPADIRWHMIGHLQSNKIKYVVGNCNLIHSVDTLKLAEQIHQFAELRNCPVNILLQLDIARDGKKQGFLESELEKVLQTIGSFRYLRVQGLMTIAPFVDYPEKNRDIFRRIKQISVDIPCKNYDNVSMNVLSMGMSNDYAIAIEEGATHLRIGTAIFGERNY